jgi:hypothetical protein
MHVVHAIAQHVDVVFPQPDVVPLFLLDSEDTRIHEKAAQGYGEHLVLCRACLVDVGVHAFVFSRARDCND